MTGRDDRRDRPCPTVGSGHLSGVFADGYLPQTRRYDEEGKDTNKRGRESVFNRFLVASSDEHGVA